MNLDRKKKIKLVNGGKLLKETWFEIDPWIAQSHLLGLLNFGETSLCVFIVAYFQFSLFDLIFFVFCLNILGVVCICV
jgi:hypothetical protein